MLCVVCARVHRVDSGADEGGHKWLLPAAPRRGVPHKKKGGVTRPIKTRCFIGGDLKHREIFALFIRADVHTICIPLDPLIYNESVENMIPQSFSHESGRLKFADRILK